MAKGKPSPRKKSCTYRGLVAKGHSPAQAKAILASENDAAKKKKKK